MSRAETIVTVVACLLFAVSQTYAQDHQVDLEKARLATQAEAILLAEEGAWNSVWETLNAKGEVVKTVKGVETYTPFNGSVRLLRTKVEGADHENTAFRFYDPTKEKLYIIDVSSTGQHYILEQEVGNDTIVSEPYRSARGTMAILRFSVVEKGENWKLVRHEVSHDDGDTWREFRRQRMEKMAAEPSKSKS